MIIIDTKFFVTCNNELEYDVYEAFMRQKLNTLINSMFAPDEKARVISELINDGFIARK